MEIEGYVDDLTAGCYQVRATGSKGGGANKLGAGKIGSAAELASRSMRARWRVDVPSKEIWAVNLPRDRLDRHSREALVSRISATTYPR